jgi:hypothetical protein
MGGMEIFVIPCIILFFIGLFGATGTPLTILRKSVVLLKLPISLALKKSGSSSKFPYVVLCLVSAAAAVFWIYVGSMASGFNANKGMVGKVEQAQRRSAVSGCEMEVKEKFQCEPLLEKKDKARIHVFSSRGVFIKIKGKCIFNKHKIFPLKSEIFSYLCKLHNGKLQIKNIKKIIITGE